MRIIRKSSEKRYLENQNKIRCVEEEIKWENIMDRGSVGCRGHGGSNGVDLDEQRHVQVGGGGSTPLSVESLRREWHLSPDPCWFLQVRASLRKFGATICKFARVVASSCEFPRVCATSCKFA